MHSMWCLIIASPESLQSLCGEGFVNTHIFTEHVGWHSEFQKQHAQLEVEAGSEPDSMVLKGATSSRTLGNCFSRYVAYVTRTCVLSLFLF